jgi:hypothetical protein
MDISSRLFNLVLSFKQAYYRFRFPRSIFFEHIRPIASITPSLQLGIRSRCYTGGVALPSLQPSATPITEPFIQHANTPLLNDAKILAPFFLEYPAGLF